MQYRTFQKTGIQVSEISLGAEHIESAPYETVREILDMAMAAGVNYTDLFMGSPDIRDHFGRALKGRRDRMMIAGHLGAAWKDGQYHRTRDMQMVKDFYYDLLKRLDTDYIDMLMIHYVDEMDDLKTCLEDGILEFALAQKQKGAARMIGIATHVPQVARAAIATGHMDAIMFSVNPLFDLMPPDYGIDKLWNEKDSLQSQVSMDNERRDLYTLCERECVGIVVMKTYAGGRLLGEDTPVKLTPSQCIHYALSQPGVVAAVLGCRSAEEYAQSLRYLSASEGEKDFSIAYREALKWSGTPKCLYCNHCLPCPRHIDIAAAMRRVDAGGAPPAECTGCGVCETRCPFNVEVASMLCP